MYYPEELIEEIRQKNDIVDVISSYVGLQKKGSNYTCCCPFHNEKTPSFSVNRARQIYKCFGCGQGGNVVTFVMKYENMTFPEAIKLLADRVGVTLPEMEYSDEMKKKESRRSKLLEINKEAAKYFFYQLRIPRGEVANQYLDKRKILPETKKNWGLGYAPNNGVELVQYLRQKGYSDDLILASGLASHSEKYGTSCKFWNRVMFPIQDINHRVIGFGGRVMGDGEPKYLNSPETEIFDKGRNLYGLNFARTARTGNIILCEGYMDVIAMHQAGFTQAVASLGTAFTAGQANILKRYTKDVLLAYDSDGAGVKAALRAIGILRDVGMSGKVINMQPYKDPDEFMKALGKDAFQERIDQAENAFMFEIRMLEREFDLNDPDGKTRFQKEIARKLCNFSEDAERENYLEAVVEKYHVGYDNMRKMVVHTAAQTGLAAPIPERPRSGVREKNTPEENSKKSQRLLLTWLTEQPSLYFKIEKYISPKDFTIDLYRQVAERMFSDIKADNLNPANIINMFTEEEDQNEAASLFTTRLEALEREQDQEKAFHDILLSVKRNSFQYYSSHMGSDITALNQVIEGKRALEELSKTHISFN